MSCILTGAFNAPNSGLYICIFGVACMLVLVELLEALFLSFTERVRRLNDSLKNKNMSPRLVLLGSG